MEVQLQKLYFSEVDSGRLMYEDDPEYERRRQALSSCLERLEVIRDPEARDLLWDAVLRFTDQSDLVSFAHGLRLGLRDRKSTRLNSSHKTESRMPSSA